MAQNGYPGGGGFNSEKTNFMKCKGSDFIIMMHCLFVYYTMHIPTCYKLSDEFLRLHQEDVEITGGGLLETLKFNIARDGG